MAVPRPLLALLPALGLFLFAGWLGTFGSGADWWAAAAAQAVVLVAGATVGRRWRDPWRLGSPGFLLPWALLAAAGLAWWLSPVPRAGRVALALLPAFLWLPSVVARAWRDPAARRWGARGVALAVAAVAAWALVLWLRGVVPRPSLPVGHHLHTTAWLVVLLPLALLPWREGGAWRWLAGTAGVLAVAGVLGARTLSGGAALAVQGALAGTALLRGPTGPRPRWRLGAAVALAVAGIALAGVLGPDVAALLQGRDPSASARWTYARAGWAGVAERPVAGLGPGATPWTLAAFLRPVPGVNPPGEVVGELHLLPLALAYELGVPGALLAGAAAALFTLRRLRERPAADRPLVAAGLLGLAGMAAAGLGTAEWRVTALPVAASVAAGAALAGGRPPVVTAGRRSGARPGERLHRLVPAVVVLAAAVALAPGLLAHRWYDAAVDASPARALRSLDRAVALDPAFPLYRARRAWLRAERTAGGAAAPGEPAGAWVEPGARSGTGQALAAAERAVAVAPLWLAAASLEADAGRSWSAAAAYERACALDPLGALAPFGLLEVAPPGHAPEALGARSLAAEPRLGAATAWAERPGVLDGALRVLTGTEGLDPGWRTELAKRVREVEPGLREAPGAAAPPADRLVLTLDRTPAESASLVLFRRRPWPARIAGVPLRPRGAAALAPVPPATTLHGTDPHLFPPTCAGPFAPQELRKTLWKTW